MRHSASLPVILSTILSATPAAAQIGINGTRQAAATGNVDIRLSPFSRCGAGNREAAALAGGQARAVQREWLTMEYRRLRYAGSGLTEAEAEMLEQRARSIERAARYGYRGQHSAYDGRRSNGAGGRRPRSRC
jgi:hypothetical protein